MTLFAVPAAWLAGGLAGLVLKTPVNPYLTTVSFLVLGGLVAADLKITPRVMITLVSVFGLFHGYLNGSVMAQARLGLLGLIGITATVFVLITLVAGFVVSLKAKWTRTAVRVAGSWVAAMGILLLGWAVKGGCGSGRGMYRKPSLFASPSSKIGSMSPAKDSRNLRPLSSPEWSERFHHLMERTAIAIFCAAFYPPIDLKLRSYL
jgi:hypothetical protein